MEEIEEIKEGDEQKGFWSYGRVALVALGVVLLVVAVSTTGRRAEKPAAKSVTKSAASAKPPAGAMDEAISALDGGTFRLSDYKGKIVVLDLWATWCRPCRMEIPHLVEIAAEYGPRGVEVIGLSVENPDQDAELVRDFAREFKINYRLGWADHDWFLTMTRNNGAIPQTFVFDRDGLIRLHAPGYRKDLPQLIRNAIEKADGRT